MYNRERREVVTAADVVVVDAAEMPAFVEVGRRHACLHCLAPVVGSALLGPPQGAIDPLHARDSYLKVAAVDRAARGIALAEMSPRDLRQIAFPAESPRSPVTSEVVPARGIAQVAEDRRVAIVPIWERAAAPAAAVDRGSVAPTAPGPENALGQANDRMPGIVRVQAIVQEAEIVRGSVIAPAAEIARALGIDLVAGSVPEPVIGPEAGIVLARETDLVAAIAPEEATVLVQEIAPAKETVPAQGIAREAEIAPAPGARPERIDREAAIDRAIVLATDPDGRGPATARASATVPARHGRQAADHRSCARTVRGDTGAMVAGGAGMIGGTAGGIVGDGPSMFGRPCGLRAALRLAGPGVATRRSFSTTHSL